MNRPAFIGVLLVGVLACSKPLLLDPEEEERFSRKPNMLYEMVMAAPEAITHVVIDEVQKIPKLLDVVHRLMGEGRDLLFVLTGSSARKLKRGGANLLAGRAFVYHFFPLTSFEIGNRFDLHFKTD